MAGNVEIAVRWRAAGRCRRFRRRAARAWRRRRPSSARRRWRCPSPCRRAAREARSRRGWRSGFSRTWVSGAESALFDHQQRLAVFDRLAVLAPGSATTVPACGAGMWFIVFMASTISSVWPASTLAPISTKVCSAGLGRAIGGADHRRLDRSGVFGPGSLARHGRGSPGRSGDGRRHRRIGRHLGWLAGDPQAHRVVLDLDLGETGLVHQRREIADHRLVDCGLGVAHGAFRRHGLWFVLRQAHGPAPSCSSWQGAPPEPRGQARSRADRSRK